MQYKAPFYVGRAFFATKDQVGFSRSLKGLLESIGEDRGIFAADNLITWGKSVGWVEDQDFVQAFNTHAKDAVERTIAWRTVTLAWAARQALRVEGDFVECGCYKGTTAHIIYDVAKLAGSDRRFFLYDLFDGAEGIALHAMVEHGPQLETQVRARFAGLENVVITQGLVPATFEQASPEKIAFMHIDMNNAPAEIGALEALFERVTPGGVIVLDDYGWIAYRAQQLAERDWFASRGYFVLELPTGQGLVIR
jgi:hypothetical protein